MRMSMAHFTSPRRGEVERAQRAKVRGVGSCRIFSAFRTPSPPPSPRRGEGDRLHKPHAWRVVRAYVLFAVCVLLACATIAPASADPAFQAFLQSLWPQAQELGISRATFDAATRGLEPDLSLPDLVLPGRPPAPERQAEFVQTPADYLKEPAIARLAVQGKKLYDQYRPTLDAIAQRFGVDPTIVLAIWGRESDYGRAHDSRNAIRVLATQAYLGKRKDKFRDEFLAALKIV